MPARRKPSRGGVRHRLAASVIRLLADAADIVDRHGWWPWDQDWWPW